MHLLIWLQNKTRAEQIDSIITAELPNENIDPELLNIVKSSMIHGPCGKIKPNACCMVDRKCSKNYPKKFLNDTQTGHDGYPLYKRRNPENGGFETNINERGNVFSVDNRWVVPYSPLLCKIFNAHINVELCNSISL